jgi:hypothetical protein
MISQERVAEIVEFAEGAACADLFRGAPDSFEMHLDECDEYVALVAPQIDILLFNRVIGLGLRTDATQELVESLAERYRAAGLKSYGFQLSPNARPRELVSWIEKTGLRKNDSWSKMYRDASPLDPVRTDLRIQQIDSEHADVFGVTACQGFGIPIARSALLTGTIGAPGWMHYIAWDGDTPAAIAAMRVEGNVGWLGIAATLPAFRNRGAQGALMSRRILDGIDAGCEWLVTETGTETPARPNPSYHNMIRTGFKLAYERPNYML